MNQHTKFDAEHAVLKNIRANYLTSFIQHHLSSTTSPAPPLPHNLSAASWLVTGPSNFMQGFAQLVGLTNLLWRPVWTHARAWASAFVTHFCFAHFSVTSWGVT